MKNFNALEMYKTYSLLESIPPAKSYLNRILFSDVKQGYADNWPLIVRLTDEILHNCVFKDQPVDISLIASEYNQLSKAEQYAIDVIMALCLCLQEKENK